jgi:uncharacterized protein DUF1996
MVVSLAACNSGASTTLPASPSGGGQSAAQSDQQSLGVLASSGRAPAPAAAPRVLFHEWNASCNTDVQNVTKAPAGQAAFIDAAQDPIVHPGVVSPAMQHVHTFWGNLGINPSATVDTLMASPSTCNVVGGHQAWWIPQASLDGVPIHPVSITMYYKMGPDGFNGTVTPFANGIRILQGSSTQTQAQFAQNGSWTCGVLPRTSDVPDSCAPGTDLVVRLNGPHCMADVTLTDSPDHRSHIVNSVSGPNGGQVCPADHPIAVPMPVWKISYRVTGAGLKNRFKISFMNADGTVGQTGPAWSFHADEFFAFDPTTFATFVNHCINGGLQCDHTGNGPHITL